MRFLILSGRILLLMVVLSLVFILSSCVGVYSSKTPEGAERQFYAQLGMKNEGIQLPQGGSINVADGEKSFGQAMTAAGAAVTAYTWGAVEKAKSAASAATAQTGIKAGAATEQARISATQATATSLGNNPEANVGAINAAGNLFK